MRTFIFHLYKFQGNGSYKFLGQEKIYAHGPDHSERIANQLWGTFEYRYDYIGELR